MIGVHINDWLIDNSRDEAADIMGVSRQAVYKMIDKGRDIRVFRQDGEWTFVELKQLNKVTES